MPQPETIQMDGELTLEIPIPASTRLWMFKSSANPPSRSLLGSACRSSAPYTSPSPSERRFTSCSPDAFLERRREQRKHNKRSSAADFAEDLRLVGVTRCR